MENRFLAPYLIDVVFCINTTVGMARGLDEIKEAILQFPEALRQKMEATGREMDQIRVRLITFGDSRENPVRQTKFCELPRQWKRFTQQVQEIEPSEGCSIFDSKAGFEALEEAVRSKWMVRCPGKRNRNIIVLYTDAPAAVESEKSLEKLQELWQDREGYTHFGRLIMAAPPHTSPWKEISERWNYSLLIPVEKNGGLEHFDHQAPVEALFPFF